MAIRSILTFPDPFLQKVSKPIKEFGPALQPLIDDMIETMQIADGIGLAAPQIGESVRLIVLQIPPDREEGEEKESEPSPLYVVCNPELSNLRGEASMEEGCLSCPGITVEVERAAEVTVKGQNPDGSPFQLEASGLTAICFQHEIDHLDGKLLLNYVSAVKRELYRTEVKKRKESGKDFSDEPRKAL